MVIPISEKNHTPYSLDRSYVLFSLRLEEACKEPEKGVLVPVTLFSGFRRSGNLQGAASVLPVQQRVWHNTCCVHRFSSVTVSSICMAHRIGKQEATQSRGETTYTRNAAMHASI